MIKRVDDYRVEIDLGKRISYNEIWKECSEAMREVLQRKVDPGKLRPVEDFVYSEKPVTLKGKSEREMHERVLSIISKDDLTLEQIIKIVEDNIPSYLFDRPFHYDTFAVTARIAGAYGDPEGIVLVTDPAQIQNRKLENQIYAIELARALPKAFLRGTNDPFARNTLAEYLGEEVVKRVDSEIPGSYAVYLDEIYISSLVAEKGIELPKIHRIRAEQAIELGWLPVPARVKTPEELYAVKFNEFRKAMAFKKAVEELGNKGVEGNAVVKNVLCSYGTEKSTLILHLPSDEYNL